MSNEKRSLQRAEIVDAIDPQAVRQRLYDRKQGDLMAHMEHVHTTFKTMVTYTVMAVGSLLVLVGMLTAMFGNLHDFLATSSAFMQLVLKWFLPAVLTAVGIWLLRKLYGAWKAYTYDRLVERRMQDEIDEITAEIKREDKRVEADVEKVQAEAASIRAEAAERQARAQQLLLTLPFDEQGNLVYRDPMTGELLQFTGQMREHPLLTSYHNAPRLTGGETSVPALASGTQEARPLPKVETFYELIPRNSLQVGMGIEAETGKPVLAPIAKSTHFKLIGGSGMGKSCVAAAMLDIAATTNDPDHLRIGLLDLEHNTSRLFEDLPHIAEIGPRKQRLVGRDPDEVAQKLKLLQWELTRRAQLGEEYCRQHEPILLVYVEEMLALKYEVVDEKLKKEMLAAINILGVRARKYGIFLLACMQVDYSGRSTREAMAQFRTRAGFAIDPEAARASSFFNTELVNQNFKQGRSGQYVLEKPSFSGLVLSPDYA